jgi:hypothetical protein
MSTEDEQKNDPGQLSNDNVDHPGPRNMGLKFLALQLFMLIFGVSLFFALVGLKTSNKKDKELTKSAFVSEQQMSPVDKKKESPDESDMPGCAFDQYIGQSVDSEKLETLGRPYRILPPGAMATMDYVPERVNFHVDDKGIVLRVRCG